MYSYQIARNSYVGRFLHSFQVVAMQSWWSYVITALNEISECFIRHVRYGYKSFVRLVFKYFRESLYHYLHTCLSTVTQYSPLRYTRFVVNFSVMRARSFRNYDRSIYYWYYHDAGLHIATVCRPRSGYGIIFDNYLTCPRATYNSAALRCSRMVCKSKIFVLMKIIIRNENCWPRAVIICSMV